MALVWQDRTLETTTTTGTGTYALLGAVTGYQSFSGVGNTNTCYYSITNGTDWEVGLGTWATGNSLARTTILDSSNAAAAVSWAAGTKTIWLDSPAAVQATGMTLLGTLTTTSGTTQSLTNIPAGYRQLYFELEGVSFTVSAALAVALSSTNGAAYTSAVTCSALTGSAAGAIAGSITITGVGSAVSNAKFLIPSTVATTPNTPYTTGAGMGTTTNAAVNAIQFSGGTFDAGTIRIYGVK